MGNPAPNSGSIPQITSLEQLTRWPELINSLGEGILLCDLEERVVFMNKRMEALTGYGLEEIKGQPGYQYLLPETELEILRKATERRIRGISDSYHLKMHRKDGSEFWAEVTASPIFNEAGVVVATLAAVNDITRRIEALEALKASEARFRSYFELSLVGMATTSLNKQWIDVNDQACHLLGYSREELFKLSWADLTHPDDLELDVHHFERVLKGEIDGYSINKRYIKKSGEILYAQISVNCVRDSTGDVKYFVALIQDVSEFRRAQNEIISQREFLKKVIDANPNPVFAKDANGVFVLANQALASVYRTTPEDIIGKHNGVFVTRSADLERQLSEDQQVLKTGRMLLVLENKYVDPESEEVRWFQTIKVPFYRNEGDAPLVLGVAADITEHKRAEAANIELQRQLMQAQKMEAIGQLAAGIAHDLNNSLAAVVGHLQLLKMESLSSAAGIRSANAANSVELALSGCERAANLVEQLLSFSRQGQYSPKPLNVSKEIKNGIAFVERAVGSSVKLEFTSSPEEYFVHADSTQFHQVLTNLVFNADHAMPSGGIITISVDKEMLTDPRQNQIATTGSFVVVRVRDTGCGIPLENLDKVFEPFFTTKPDGAGTGLGLAMVYGIMQNHGGWVDVSSKVGEGTTFALYYPLLNQATGADSSQEKNALDSSTLNARPLAKKLIMIVDDESGLVDLAKQFFTLAGYDAVGFTDTEAALSWYREHGRTVDLAILDMKMPKSDGATIFHQLRTLNPQAKVAMLSGFIDESRSQELLEAGALKFFRKPVKYPELVSWVGGVLGVK